MRRAQFLDSAEVGLLMIPLFSDVETRGGCTFISPDGLTKVIEFLRDHPEGVGPGRTSFDFAGIARESEHFVECTGKAGDVSATPSSLSIT